MRATIVILCSSLLAASACSDGTGPTTAPLPLADLTSYTGDANTVLLLHLDEPDGPSVADASGLGNDGTATGTTVVPGQFALARRFDNSPTSSASDFISLGTSESLNPPEAATFEFWLYLTSSTSTEDGWTNGNPILSREDATVGDAGYLFATYTAPGFPANRPYFSDGNTCMSPQGVPLGSWTHVAFTLQNNLNGTKTCEIYINGNLTASIIMPDPIRTSSAVTYLGRRFGSGGGVLENQGFQGIIDEVRISDRVRSPDEFNLGPVALPFVDTFDRPDNTVVGNRWSQFARGGSSLISANALYIISGTASGDGAKVSHSLPRQSGLRISGTVTFIFPSTRFWVLVRADGTESLRNGYGFSWRFTGLADNPLVLLDNTTDDLDAGGFATVDVQQGLAIGQPINFEMLVREDNALDVRVWAVGTPRPEAATIASGPRSPQANGGNLALVESTGDPATGEVIVEEIRVVEDLHPNAAPSANAGGPYSGAEGAPIALTLGGTDPDGDQLTFTWDLGDGTVGSGATPPASHTYVDNAPAPATAYTITLTADDGRGGTDTKTAVVGVTNVAPTLASVTAPTDPISFGTPVTVAASFTDPGSADTHVGFVQWDAGTPFEPANPGVDQAAGTLTATRVLDPGVYTVSLRVRDDDGGEDTITAPEFAVVFDASQGFVTGGGWILSPPGAYLPDPAVTGKVTFGFVAKYQQGSSIPSGQTRVQFSAAGFGFKSTSYEILSVGGPHGRYQGVGEVNGVSGYGFSLTANDGDLPGGGGADAVRIKIWSLASGAVVYDNQRGASENSNAVTVLGGGSIVIHK